ncbi:hypothetical protein [Streptomyces sp. HB132]|uniref:hypothetical protein n=1 Tax=Streptomyces sp. HB132 TaxID=767388 RepID=UPI0019603D7B|nr:hypothetical protein [Streptomyces sp. HB132]MBM7437758.1 hypothetical protein [Streptomyces sp. HB132]
MISVAVILDPPRFGGRQVAVAVRRVGRPWEPPTASAITRARKRLVRDVLWETFYRVAVPVATSEIRGAWPRGWRPSTDSILRSPPFDSRPERRG